MTEIKPPEETNQGNKESSSTSRAKWWQEFWYKNLGGPNPYVSHQSRRKFNTEATQLGAIATSSVALGWELPENFGQLPEQTAPPENKERLRPAHTPIFDFPLVNSKEEFIQELAKMFSVELNVPQLTESESEDLYNAFDPERFKTDESYRLLIILDAYAHVMWNHGTRMTNGWKETMQLVSGTNRDTAHASLFDAIVNVQSRDDGNGETIVSFVISETMLNQVIQQSLSRVVNMSFQVGINEARFKHQERIETRISSTFVYVTRPAGGQEEIEVFYPVTQAILDSTILGVTSPTEIIDGQVQLVSTNNLDQPFAGYLTEEAARATAGERIDTIYPEVEIIEPYSGDREKVKSNLRRLVWLAKQNPAKLLVASAGNVNSFFAPVRLEITQEEDWPENLLMVGMLTEPAVASGMDLLIGSTFFEHSYQRHRGSEGSDSISQVADSSESAAIVSALAEYLLGQHPNFSPRELRTLIVNLATDERTIEGDPIPVPILHAVTDLFSNSRMGVRG